MKQFNLTGDQQHLYTILFCMPTPNYFPKSPLNVWSKVLGTEGLSFCPQYQKCAICTNVGFSSLRVKLSTTKNYTLGCKIQQFKVVLNTYHYYIPEFFQSKSFPRHFTVLCVPFNYLGCSFSWISSCLAYETKSNSPDGSF